MKKKLIIAISGIITIIAVAAAVILYSTIFVTAEYSSQYNKIFGEFTADTSSQLLKDKNENTCYSPVSMFGALSMFAEMTEGDTQAEVLEVLGFDSVKELEENYQQMLGDIDIDNNSSKITLANSLWYRGVEISEETQSVVDNMNKKLDCDFFLKDTIISNDVNDWINEKTNGLIPQIINSDDKQTIFINALYFKSGWKKNVGEIPKQQPFYLENGNEVDATYLFLDEEMLFYKVTSDYTFVEVPLNCGKAIFVLPNEDNTLQQIVDKATLNEILASTTKRNEKEEGLVNIRFPKFEITYNVGTDEIYKVFETRGAGKEWDEPDWINELQGDELEISQKTHLIVNEEGIEAAAASSIMVDVIGTVAKKALDITFDRPFMYILMKDGVPLFIGTVYNPAE